MDMKSSEEKKVAILLWLHVPTIMRPCLRTNIMFSCARHTVQMHMPS